MNSVERVRAICTERKIPISRLERDLGFSNGYIGQLRKGVFPADRLAMIADYLDVNTYYLLTGEGTEKAPTQEGERDFAQNHHEEDMLLLARHMAPIPEEDRNALKEQFKNSMDLYLKAKGLSGSD